MTFLSSVLQERSTSDRFFTRHWIHLGMLTLAYCTTCHFQLVSGLAAFFLSLSKSSAFWNLKNIQFAKAFLLDFCLFSRYDSASCLCLPAYLSPLVNVEPTDWFELNLKDQDQKDRLGPSNFMKNTVTLEMPTWEGNSSYLLPPRESSWQIIHLLKQQNQAEISNP